MEAWNEASESGRNAKLDIGAIPDKLAVNDIVYAELSVRYARIEELDAIIRGARLVYATMPPRIVSRRRGSPRVSLRRRRRDRRLNLIR
jgi:hypothetical protein